ncbi:D-alanine--poly(phosphoribitol) ligase, subunit 1 [Collimonas fungivorans]|uniref:D-alanine--poly(Phosphoribitol) ligase, subunit 1 n=1 Tax=Collimonas fungivorans TaxID=158899 RepID=A0A127P5X2_9BURK|nr:D-alanine--poly(phosphoribitol) ligase, subunit 1 [Collimonas fungivorans]
MKDHKSLNLVDILRARSQTAADSAERLAFTNLRSGEQIEEELTFSQLDRRARRIAAHLLPLINKGDRVLVVFPAGLDYISAFFGCLYAGAIAVPALVPTNSSSLSRLGLIARDAGAQVALATAAIATEVLGWQQLDDKSTATNNEFKIELSRLTWIAADQLNEAEENWAARDLDPDDIAFLQYTSGSTSIPKGVMVSHANIIANVHLIHACFPISQKDTVVSWLPPHHDMGLVGKILFPVLAGAHCVIMPPSAFMLRPHRWLLALSKYKARLTAAPNFAYELCASRVTDRQKLELDLSSLEFALNGAEVVRPETLERFYAAFRGCGLRQGVVRPVYGLAEGTLLVSASDGIEPVALSLDRTALSRGIVEECARDADKAVAVISTGRAGQHTVIVDPQTGTFQPDGRVGEIWIRGASIARGYWNRPDETSRTFHASVCGGAPEYLRSGDLGFILGEKLHVVDRIKDLMIVNGRNVYAHDVESLVGRLDPAFRNDGAAAFSVDRDGRERLVIVQEIDGRSKPDTEQLAVRLRAVLLEQLDTLELDAIVLVKAGHLPRTSSGKIQRSRCRDLFLADAFSAIWSWRISEVIATSIAASVGQGEDSGLTPTERVLSRIWTELLGLECIPVSSNFFSMGGQSLSGSQVISKVKDAFQVEMRLEELFEAPTIRSLASRIDEAMQQGTVVSGQCISRRVGDGPVPLSFAQRGIWFLEQLEPRSGLYSISGSLRIQGGLDVALFEQALNEVVRRHESLRTNFVLEKGVPMQIVAPSLHIAPQFEDLNVLESHTAELQLRRFMQEETRHTFDLAAGPLLRVRVVCLSEVDQVVLLTMHHIVSDGWSMGLLIREIGLLYRAFAAGQSPNLPELSIQYGDYAAWQHATLAGGVWRQRLASWVDLLRGTPAVLELPTDRPRPTVQDHRGANHSFTISAAVTQELRELGSGARASLFMILATAFNVLLARISGQNDICLGTPIANRGHREIEGLIGLFVNTIVLRSRVNPEASLASLLEQVRSVSLNAYAHQDIPFEQVVEALGLERRLSHHPLVQVVLVLQNTPSEVLELPMLSVQQELIEGTSSKFDLTLTFSESEGALNGVFEYATALFDDVTIARMAKQYLRVVQAMLSDMQQPLGCVELLDETERRNLLAHWRPARTWPKRPTIALRFEDCVARFAHRTALVFEGNQLSYEQLNRRANRLAHYLRAQGVSADILVGLCVERSLDMVVGLLAILKAGGAYVPLDPDYPRERLAYMLQDAAPVLVLSQSHLAGRLPETASRIIYLDVQNGELDTYPDNNPESINGPQDLAYAIYTSGSTGRSKGALLAHQNVLRLFESTQQWFQFDENDVWTMFHSYAFDFSVWEIWGALLYGGKLVVVPYGVSRAPERFHALLVQEKVTILNQTPSAFQQLVELDVHLPMPVKLALRLVIFGGEALNFAALGPWFLAHGDNKPQLVNMYGITETTVHVTYHSLVANGAATASIGLPLPDLGIYVLDASCQPVPAGIVGEMYVVGAGLARGYLNRPGLTAERFIADPYGDPGTRMYRTGDLARWCANGELEYLGRADQQLKIRGFRIEPGEVESALAAHPGIAHVVVMSREGNSGGKLLVAYVVPKLGTTTDVNEWLEHARQSLPDYMVPSAFVALKELPLTPNGKLDRNALPNPVAGGDSAGFRAPSTATELTLARIWAEVLGLEAVSVLDNFFVLGGDSMRTIKIISKAKESGIVLTLEDFFEHQTIASLAGWLASRAEHEVAPTQEAMVLISEVDRGLLPAAVEDAYVLSRLQAGMIFHHQYSPERGTYHDFLSYRLKVVDWDGDLLRIVLGAMVQQHAILRTAFNLQDYSEPLQLVFRTAEIPVLEFDVSDCGEDEQNRSIAGWMLEEKKQLINIAMPPLLKIFIHRRAVDELQFTVSCHHAVLDGWSVATFLTELFVEYDKLHRNEHHFPALKPLSTSLKQTIMQERLAMRSEDERAFWRNYLAGCERAVLPPYREDGLPPSQLGISWTVPQPLVDRLNEVVRRLNMPLRTLLLAVHLRVMGVLSGHTDVVTGVVTHARPEAQDGERVLGLFLNTLPFRQLLKPGSWVDLLGSVFASELIIAPHRRYPHSQLLLDNDRVPLFETIFNYINFHVFDDLRDLKSVEVLDSDGFEATNFAFGINAISRGRGLTFKVDYDPTRFSLSQAKRFSDYYLLSLRAIAADVDGSYWDLDFLAEAERDQILVQWNDTAREVQEQTLVELFEAQVEATPQAVALVCGEQELSYGELNARANRLAHVLISRGVGRDGVVGICMDRSLEMVVAILGVLKAGGAYLPLDPDAPSERLAHILGQANPVLVLTRQAQEVVGLRAQGVGTLQLEAGAQAGADALQWDPRLGVGLQDLAYVIYTSGSTGKPKGVAVTHGGLSNYVQWARTAYPMQGQDGAYVHLPLVFDATLTALLVPLTVGQSVVLQEGTDASALVEYLREKRHVGLLKITPAHIDLVSQELQGQAVGATVGVSVVGGEALTVSQTRRWLEHFPQTLVVNEYGPTETVVGCCVYTTRELGPREVGAPSLPIGRPIANTQLYVLDTQLRLAPVGVAGELYIAGAGLARGYLGRPGLTAERFVACMHGQPGARMYRSGDLARWREDGQLEYLGRVDHQVKIRGYRIEPGEIEAVLAQHEEIEQALVMVREDSPGEKRLVAYVVARQQQGAQGHDALLHEQLRQHLASQLPEYMVPAAIVVLERLLLNANGKVERRALPVPQWQGQAQYLAPSNALQRTLVQIYAQVLHVPEQQLSVNDSFFELGGDSIGSIRVVGLARKAGLVITPREVFEHRSVAGLARVARAVQEVGEVLEEEPQGMLELTPIMRWQLGGGGDLRRFHQGCWCARQRGCFSRNCKWRFKRCCKATRHSDSDWCAASTKGRLWGCRWLSWMIRQVRVASHGWT